MRINFMIVAMVFLIITIIGGIIIVIYKGINDSPTYYVLVPLFIAILCFVIEGIKQIRDDF